MSRSANSVSFTLPVSRAKYRTRLAMSALRTMALSSRSMAACALCITSIMPNPAGLPAMGNSTSNTNGYLPWS